MQLSYQKSTLTKIEDGGRRISNFENVLPFLHNWINPHQSWWECWESATKRNCHIENVYRTFTKTQDGGRRHLEFRKSIAISFLLDQSSWTLVVMLRISHRTQLSYCKCLCTKIKDGGRRYLECRKGVAISLLLDQSSPNPTGIMRIWKKRNRLQKCIFTHIHDGGRHNLEFQKCVAISLLFDQSLLNLMGMLKIWQRTQLSYLNAYPPEFKKASAAILNLKMVLIFLYYWTNPHQISWKCW